MNEKTKTLGVFLKNNQWFLMFASVVFGIIATMLVHVYIRNKVLSISGGGFVPIIAVVKDMKEGSVITEECISVRKVPASIAHNKIILQQYVDYVIGQKARTNLYEGQPLLWNDVSVEKPAALSQKLKSNERAISLFVDDATGLKGLLNPGNRVDIIGFFDIPGEDFRSVQSVTKVILQNITVLAVGNNMSPLMDSYVSIESQKPGMQQPETASQNVPNTVTLRVNAEDVPMLIFAEKKGEIFLSLRSDADIIVEPVPEAGYKELSRLESAFGKAQIAKKEGYPVIFEGGKEKPNVFLPSDNFAKDMGPFTPELKEQIQKLMEEKKLEDEAKKPDKTNN